MKRDDRRLTQLPVSKIKNKPFLVVFLLPSLIGSHRARGWDIEGANQDGGNHLTPKSKLSCFDMSKMKVRWFCAFFSSSDANVTVKRLADEEEDRDFTRSVRI